MDNWSVVIVAEVVGTFAIVVSLLFVGYQVSQNTKHVRANTDRHVGDAIRANLQLIAENEGLANILIRCHADPEILTDAESARYQAFLQLCMDSWEYCWWRREDGLMSQIDWREWDTYFTAWAKKYLTRQHWPIVKWGYSDEFVQHVDRILEASALPPAAADATSE